MRLSIALAFTFLASTALAGALNRTDAYYILHHDPSHASLADVAHHLGLQILNPIGQLKDMWLARADTLPNSMHARNTADPVVESYWAMRRDSQKREIGTPISSAIKHISRQTPRLVTTHPFTSTSEIQARRPDTDRLGIQDPSFREQWSLIDLHVPQVWGKGRGYTGKGVLIAIVDDGLKYDHKDISKNFDADHSFDFISDTKHLSLPLQPFFHGTAVAGVIAASRNDLCGVGIAYNAKLAALRILGSHGIWDAHEAAALNHAAQSVDIYSSAYGMNTFTKPHYATRQAYLYGVNYGRNWKGSVYVVAAGSHAEADSNCNTNGWANSIYTIAIAAVDRDGRHPVYSAPCTAVMAATYSSNAGNTSRIFSLNIDHDESCSDFFGGTSASAPAASGIFALALEANPSLTWRDIEYLIVHTSNFIRDSWTPVAGRKYSEELGFGVLDATAFVNAAKNWATVPELTWIQTDAFQFEDGTMDHEGNFGGGVRLDRRGVETPIYVTHEMADRQHFGKVEKVEVKVWVKHQKRGDVEVTLVSPSGTESRLGTRRREDRAWTGLRGWTFMSVKHWGESPIGEWTLKVNDQKEKHLNKAKGRLIGFSLTFWGCANEKGWEKLYEMPEDDYDVFPPPGKYAFRVGSDDEEEGQEGEGVTADYSLDSE